MKITIIGSGYVGLVSGVCFSDFGFNVICADKDEDIIAQLNDGISPIYEPGLSDLLEKNIYYQRLSFTTDLESAIKEGDVIFIALGTPQNDDGSADLSSVVEAAKLIGKSVVRNTVVATKSTVPVGTSKLVRQIIKHELETRGLDLEIDMVSNPEFLRQGSAVHDFTHADRVVIGAESQRAAEIMKHVYRVLYINETPFMIVNLETAEMIKYASNSFLATKISFVNELSQLCEKVGADIQHVSKGMGMDGRIGTKFLHAGPGYGGSCFPKDTSALASIGDAHQCDLGIVKATIRANEKQKQRMADMIAAAVGDLAGKRLAILGLAFKNNTDDMRESPAVSIISSLAEQGAMLQVYDPKAMIKAEEKFRSAGILISKYCNDEYDACSGAEAVVLITEWNQFRSLDLQRIRSVMQNNLFFDLRNIYPGETVREAGFKYFSVGRSN